METSLHQQLSNAALRIMRPLAKVLLSHGMAYGVFAEIARRAFVDAAEDLIRAGDQRATVSSVAALTGLTRKEVSRLKTAADIGDPESMGRYSRAVRVITGWTTDARYTDSNGEPAQLPLEGDTGSFAALVRDYSGDITPVAMLSLLENSKNIALNDGHAVLLERAYIPLSTPREKLNILGSDTAELIQVIGHNLTADSKNRFFQRKVSYTQVDADVAAEFRKLSNVKSQSLLEEYNGWLADHATSDSSDKSDKRYVAVGIYFIERICEE